MRPLFKSSRNPELLDGDRASEGVRLAEEVERPGLSELQAGIRAEVDLEALISWGEPRGYVVGGRHLELDHSAYRNGRSRGGRVDELVHGVVGGHDSGGGTGAGNLLYGVPGTRARARARAVASSGLRVAVVTATGGQGEGGDERDQSEWLHHAHC